MENFLPKKADCEIIFFRRKLSKKIFQFFSRKNTKENQFFWEPKRTPKKILRRLLVEGASPIHTYHPPFIFALIVPCQMPEPGAQDLARHDKGKDRQWMVRGYW